MSQPAAPLVSVVTPCYNQAHFLRDAIESTLAQTYPRVELVVVDDGSLDNTVGVVAGYPLARCVRQNNRGVAEARNVGFGATNGEYVLFVDADDRLAPDAVQAHLRCFAEHPQAGFVVGAIEQITGDGSYRGTPHSPILESEQYEHLLGANHIANTIAVMFRRSVFEALGGFTQYFSPAEDYELLLRAARAVPSAHHSTVVAHYRRHTTNTSRKGVIMLQAMRRVMRSQRELVRGNPRLEAAWHKGDNYWREFFGGVTVKEIYAHLGRGEMRHAARAVTALLLHVRSRLMLLPWKYRAHILAAVRRRFLGVDKLGTRRLGRSTAGH
jgi:glycosyltransferase involved in cell wall biosynthesis